MNRRRPNTLEPISAALFVTVSLHAMAAFGLWWWWHEHRSASVNPRLTWLSPGDFSNTLPAAAQPMSALTGARLSTPPAAATKPRQEPAVQKATLVSAPPQPQMEPVPNESGTPLFAPAIPATKPAANRSITLRRAPEKRGGDSPFSTPAPPMSSPTLLDIARLNALRPSPRPSGSAASTVVVEEANMDAVDEAVNAAFLAGWTAPPIDAVPAAQREARLNISIGKDGTVLKAQMNKFSGSHALDQSILEAAAQVKKIAATLPSNFAKDSYDLELNFLLLP